MTFTDVTNRAALLEALEDKGAEATTGELLETDLTTASEVMMSAVTADRINAWPAPIIERDLVFGLAGLLAPNAPVIVTAEPERREFRWEMPAVDGDGAPIVDEATGEPMAPVPMVTYQLTVRWRVDV